MSFSRISRSHTQHILGHQVDLSQFAEDGEAINDEDAYGTIHGGGPAASERNVDEKRLLAQSDTFRDLETLFVALDAFERWQDAFDQMNELV